MRKQSKKPCPQVLLDNGADWLQAYLDDRTNGTKKYRYREKTIKKTLRDETSNKCIYCESKVGHNTPGDIDHILPVAKFPNLIFDWQNLTIACTECNRRKGVETTLLNPYVDDVEAIVIHYGPIVSWTPGNAQAERTIRTLSLNSRNRMDLFLRKLEKIGVVDNLVERVNSESNDLLKQLLKLELEEMMSPNAEFSAMVCSVISANK